MWQALQLRQPHLHLTARLRRLPSSAAALRLPPIATALGRERLLLRLESCLHLLLELRLHLRLETHLRGVDSRGGWRVGGEGSGAACISRISLASPPRDMP